MLLVWASLWALADQLDAKAILILARVLDGRATKAEVADANLRLDTAILLNPFDADYRLHQVFFSRALCRNGPLKASCCDQDQLETYRHILRLRPTWGDAWLDYASCLQEQGTSLVAAKALDKALRFAPVAYGVTRRSVSLGFNLLDDMNTDQLERFRANLRLLLSKDPRFVLRKALLSDKVDFIEPLLSNEKQRTMLDKLKTKLPKGHGS